MQIHVARGDQQLGVFSPEEVRAKLASREFQPSDLGWADGQAQWTPLASFPGLSAAAAPPGVPMSYPPAAGTPGSPPPNSTAAVTSLVCGILAYTFLPIIAAIPAVICGH